MTRELVLVAALLTGCIPIYTTLLPDSRVVVVDANRNPVAGANVQLITTSFPFRLDRGRTVETTDAQGVAQFVALKEWRWVFLAPDGGETYFWNWCVLKSGFQTYATNYDGSEWFSPKTNLNVTLHDGKSTECPDYELWRARSN